MEAIPIQTVQCIGTSVYLICFALLLKHPIYDMITNFVLQFVFCNSHSSVPIANFVLCSIICFYFAFYLYSSWASGK